MSLGSVLKLSNQIVDSAALEFFNDYLRVQSLQTTPKWEVDEEELQHWASNRTDQTASDWDGDLRTFGSGSGNEDESSSRSEEPAAARSYSNPESMITDRVFQTNNIHEMLAEEILREDEEEEKGTYSRLSPSQEIYTQQNSSNRNNLLRLGLSQQKGYSRKQRNQLNHSLYRTTLCRFIQNGLICPYGQRCAYAHSLEALQTKDAFGWDSGNEQDVENARTFDTAGKRFKSKKNGAHHNESLNRLKCSQNENGMQAATSIFHALLSAGASFANNCTG